MLKETDSDEISKYINILSEENYKPEQYKQARLALIKDSMRKLGISDEMP